MTGVEFVVTYAVCWWLVLFMVLPHKAEAPAKPGFGHAPSAPENPRLGKKIRWTSLLALIPAIAFYFIVGAAYAAETVYRAGSDCAPLPTYQSSGNVDAKDGFGTGDKKVAPATLEGQNFLGDKDAFDIPIAIPSENYSNPATHSGDLSESFIQMGKLSVSKDGQTTLNGKPISQQHLSTECTPSAEKKSDNMLSTK